MILQKWDETAKVYQEYAVPDDWHVSLYESDMTTVVNCARCGNPVAYENTYCSLQIHSPMGFGYAVCPDCHDHIELPEYMSVRHRD